MVDWAFDISFPLAGLTDVELALLASVVALLTTIATVVAVIAETILYKL
jgi:hypothetical protein